MSGTSNNRFGEPLNLSGNNNGNAVPTTSAAATTAAPAAPAVPVAARAVTTTAGGGTAGSGRFGQSLVLVPAPGLSEPVAVPHSVASPQTATAPFQTAMTPATATGGGPTLSTAVPTAVGASLTPAGSGGNIGASKASQLQMNSSLLARAMQNDKVAIAKLFAHFLPAQEPILASAYLGRKGVWWLGTRSFCCLTGRRIGSLQIGVGGEVVYQDGYLDHINSGIVYQPSRMPLFVMFAFWVVGLPLFAFLSMPPLDLLVRLGAVLAVFIVCTLLSPLLIALYYQFNKCGLLFVVREGVSVYIFTNRNRLSLANDIYRAYTDLRDKRLAQFGRP